ncbi:MAG: MIP/aquaporin family protein [Actinomycetes bacterium]
MSDEKSGDERRAPPRLWRKLLAEAVGTFALTATGAAPDVVSAALNVPVPDALKAVAPGMTVAVLVYTIGDISGAHVNPVVTLAFALRRAFPWGRVPAYVAVQLLGALAAALTLRWLFGAVGHLGATRSHVPVSTALVVEGLLTTFLVTVILQAATRESLVGPQAAIPVGLTIAVDGLLGVQVTGASMNPARSLGPVLAGGPPEGWWLYVVGPLAGSLVAVGLVFALRGAYSDEKEKETAQGK